MEHMDVKVEECPLLLAVRPRSLHLDSGHFIALSISRGLRGGWTEGSSSYSCQSNKTAVSSGRARAAEKEPKTKKIVQEDLRDGRKQRWKEKSEGRELQKSAEIKEKGKEAQVIP